MQKNKNYIMDDLSTLSRSELENKCIDLEEINRIYRKQIRFLNLLIIAILIVIMVTLILVT